jgi:hypothetical protein
VIESEHEQDFGHRLKPGHSRVENLLGRRVYGMSWEGGGNGA